MKLIDKDALVAEIWKRRNKHSNFGGSPSSEYCHEDDEILGIINTLEVIYLQEEPVSEELEKVSDKYSEDIESTYLNDMFDRGDIMGAFEAGAKWQKEQFEKNRLKHCDSITKEQAELEQSFVDQHLDKHQRIPTFLDAIEYGMNLQKEQQKEI